jgi:hypothetical protein
MNTNTKKSLKFSENTCGSSVYSRIFPFFSCGLICAHQVLLDYYFNIINIKPLKISIFNGTKLRYTFSDVGFSEQTSGFTIWAEHASFALDILRLFLKNASPKYRTWSQTEAVHCYFNLHTRWCSSWNDTDLCMDCIQHCSMCQLKEAPYHSYWML